jgi:hypothetical protein
MAAPISESQGTSDETQASPIGVRIEQDLATWKEFVREQERLCAKHHFQAAMLTIGCPDEATLAQTTAALLPALRSTDHAGLLCPTELAVVLVPLDSIQHAQRLVHLIDGALRAAGLEPHIGWAMRQDGHGLFHAAARADAAMLTARGHGRPAVDLSDPRS